MKKAVTTQSNRHPSGSAVRHKRHPPGDRQSEEDIEDYTPFPFINLLSAKETL